MRKIFSTIVAMILIVSFAFPMPAYATSAGELDTAINRTARFLLDTIRASQVGEIGGEFAVIGLARSNFNVPDSFFENYFRTLTQYVRANSGALDARVNSTYSRIILAVTAAGFDPRDVAGYDITVPLGDFNRTIWQGINGATWALIALDSLDYPVPRNENAARQATREMYIAEILRRQTHDGGWNLVAGARGSVEPTDRADTDITGMVLQALANYQDRGDVREATDRALARLSQMQTAQGGFESWAGYMTVESAAQVLVGLSALGVAIDDTRFVKNGYTIVDNILMFQNANGSFRHTLDSTTQNQLSTEQAFYALVAAQRNAEGRNSLYRMSDRVVRGEIANDESIQGIDTPPEANAPIGLPNRHADVRIVPVSAPNRTFSDIQGHTNQKAIEALASRGIINGVSETAFVPDTTMTRAEFAAIVTRGLGLPLRAASVFTDVPSSAWYAMVVGTAHYYEIVRGISADEFNPHGTITRQEAAVMITRAARLSGMNIIRADVEIRDTLAIFGDQSAVAPWARESLTFCFNTGILDDYAFYIEPNRAVSRGEIAEMLYRMLGLAGLVSVN